MGNKFSKKKIFFYPSWSFFTIFCRKLPEKMIRNCFGGKEKE